MRRLILVSALAASAAFISACEPKVETPNKPVATPSPIATASPLSSPTASPAASPAKPGTSPEVKKEDQKTGVNGNVKTVATPKK